MVTSTPSSEAVTVKPPLSASTVPGKLPSSSIHLRLRPSCVTPTWPLGRFATEPPHVFELTTAVLSCYVPAKFGVVSPPPPPQAAKTLAIQTNNKTRIFCNIKTPKLIKSHRDMSIINYYSALLFFVVSTRHFIRLFCRARPSPQNLFQAKPL